VLESKNDLEASVKNFVNDSKILNIDESVIEHCVNIRRGKKIKTPDAIIAATALANGYTLITNNTGDFKNIKDLKLINPHKFKISTNNYLPAGRG
jgi:predicted nucleic acid-binding protein